MNKDEIFELYKLVQRKDKAAEDKLINEHKRQSPADSHHRIKRGESPDYRTYLHTMYLHLSR